MKLLLILGLSVAVPCFAAIPCAFDDPVSGIHFDLSSLRKGGRGYVSTSYMGGTSAGQQSDIQLNFCYAEDETVSVPRAQLQPPCDSILDPDNVFESSINVVQRVANTAGVNGSSNAVEQDICAGYLGNWNGPAGTVRPSTLMSGNVALGVQLSFSNGVVEGCANSVDLDVNIWCGGVGGIVEMTTSKLSVITHTDGTVTTGNNAECAYQVDIHAGNFVGCPSNLGKPLNVDDLCPGTGGYTAGLVILALVAAGAGGSAVFFWHRANKQMRSFALGPTAL